jgi:hypothetical protein
MDALENPRQPVSNAEQEEAHHSLKRDINALVDKFVEKIGNLDLPCRIMKPNRM